MLFIKYFILFLILLSFSLIGRFLAKKYVYRLEELKDIDRALNMLKNKIQFTYEPIPDIFNEISNNTCKNIGNIFKSASKNMESTTANLAWDKAIDEVDTNLKDEDKKTLKGLGKLLGQTDVEGQISQISITEKFLQTQINDATQERQKNEKLFTRLGTIMGLAIVIVFC